MIWSPAVDPARILLRPCPPGMDGPRLAARDDVIVGDLGKDGFCTASVRGVEFPLLFLAGGPDQPVAAVVLADHLALDRLEAVERFWAALNGDKVPPERRRMSRQKRERAGKSLRAVDGRKDGASYRVIAQVLFPAHRITLATWKSNALRETVIRLARDGLQLVAGGYRSLLHRRRHDRKRKDQAIRTG
ncbi:DUF2285 domain-containing protein [Paracoccus sp. P2]|uniref:DUF2285 domain-containing protein n=1 Tax=Paracoccus sp. P2 TaxID=3248840 RepID=UPI00391F6BD7